MDKDQGTQDRPEPDLQTWDPLVKVQLQFRGRRVIFSINGSGLTGSHAAYKESGPLTHFRCKKSVPDDQGFRCER